MNENLGHKVAGSNLGASDSVKIYLPIAICSHDINSSQIFYSIFLCMIEMSRETD